MPRGCAIGAGPRGPAGHTAYFFGIPAPVEWRTAAACGTGAGDRVRTGAADHGRAHRVGGRAEPAGADCAAARVAARFGNRDFVDQPQRRSAGTAGRPADGDGARKSGGARTIRKIVPASLAGLHASHVAGTCGGGRCGGAAGFPRGQAAFVASGFGAGLFSPGAGNMMKTESNLNGDRSEPLLRVTGLCQQFVQRRAWSRTKFTVEAFRDVDLTLFAGKTLALVGESGAGKSSLARCVALLEPPSAGKIELEGSDLLGLGGGRRFPLRRQIQMIFQDATSALNPALTAGEIIAEPLV